MVKYYLSKLNKKAQAGPDFRSSTTNENSQFPVLYRKVS